MAKATSTVTLTGSVAGDILSASRTTSTVTLTGSVTGDVVNALASTKATSTITLSGSVSGDVLSTTRTTSTVTLSAGTKGEVSSARADQAIEVGIFSPSIELTAGNGLALTIPYSDKLEVETLEHIGTLTETLDTGGYFYNGGYSDFNRSLTLVIEGASRDDIDTAKAMVVLGEVKISHWDGYYVGQARRMSVRGGELLLDVKITERQQ